MSSDARPEATVSKSGQVAFIEIRAFPWRPRARVMRPDTLREVVTWGGPDGTDLEGFVFSLAFMLVVLVAAPIIVLVLAGLLLAFEIPLLIALAVLLVIARLSGIIPWTIGVADPQTGTGEREHTRNLIRAIRRVREINGERRVPVRWSWF